MSWHPLRVLVLTLFVLSLVRMAPLVDADNDSTADGLLATEAQLLPSAVDLAPDPQLFDGTSPRRISGPDYGMNIFIWGSPSTTARDLSMVRSAGFTWQKTLFQWRYIEPERGRFGWEEADRVVKASNAAGIKVIARVDFQPRWARADGATNGPPDDYEDFGRFVYALVDHFKPGSPNGTIAAVELWNEPNLAREFGGQVMDPQAASDYVDLMCTGHDAAKRASPQIITISAGLSPTGTLNAEAADDTVFLQWMYDAGGQPCFDVLGAHGAGYKAPPWISTEELASDPSWGGHESFGFRRVEQLRDVMVANNDADKQIWLLEFGWTSDPMHESYAWHRVTEDEKALYMVEAYRFAMLNWQPWIGVMVAWNIADPHWDQSREEYWWSITNPDGTVRPAYTALSTARTNGYLPGSSAPALAARPGAEASGPALPGGGSSLTPTSLTTGPVGSSPTAATSAATPGTGSPAVSTATPTAPVAGLPTAPAPGTATRAAIPFSDLATAVPTVRPPIFLP